MLKEIAAHAQRMIPVLEQIDAKEMAKNGMPDTYITQLNESKVQAKALATEAAGAIQFAREAVGRSGHFLPHAVARKNVVFDRRGNSQVLESRGGGSAEQPDGREWRRIASASSAIFWTWPPPTNRNAP